MMKIYHYPNCSTCRKARQWLANQGLAYVEIDISQRPPGQRELKQMLGVYQGEIRKLFNTSGQLYRQLEMKTKLPDMSTDQAIKLLNNNGMLIKRPFLILPNGGGAVGFKLSEWERLLR